jgi:hypothetical protein
MLFESMLEIYHPGNYTCDLIPLQFSKIKAKSKQKGNFVLDLCAFYGGEILREGQIYIVEDLLNKKCYWMKLFIAYNSITTDDQYFYFAPIDKLNEVKVKVNINEEITINNQMPLRCIIDQFNFNKYLIYKPSVYISTIPLKYKIISVDNKKWNELCEIVMDNDLLVPISKIINVSDLRYYISTFL